MATTCTIENLDEILSAVLKDVPPHDLNHSDDEEEEKKENKNQKSHISEKKKKMDAVTISRSNAEFLGVVSEYLIYDDTCSPTLKRRNCMRMTSTRTLRSCSMVSRRPSSPLATLRKEGKHQSTGGNNGAPCCTVTPSGSAWINTCRPSTI